MDDEKVEIIDGVSYQYSSSWIHKLETEEHWRLYWRQQQLMNAFIRPSQTILEIGVGSGFTANYLRSRGINVTTVDIDPQKKPNIVANIVNYEFNNVYDHVLAFETFEHIPFDKFIQVATNISKACRGYLFMSVPRCERVPFRLEYKIPFLKPGKIELTIRKGKITTPHHHWEVDQGQVTYECIINMMSGIGFQEVHRYKVFSRIFFAFRKSTDV